MGTFGVFAATMIESRVDPNESGGILKPSQNHGGLLQAAATKVRSGDADFGLRADVFVDA
jgi:hypothetical protein